MPALRISSSTWPYARPASVSGSATDGADDPHPASWSGTCRRHTSSATNARAGHLGLRERPQSSSSHATHAAPQRAPPAPPRRRPAPPPAPHRGERRLVPLLPPRRRHLGHCARERLPALLLGPREES